ncbi:MAG: hypothetical protein AAFV25_23325 [Bacteroidota bacterium]
MMAQLKLLILEKGYTEWYHQLALDVSDGLYETFQSYGWTGEAVQINMSGDKNQQWWKNSAPAELKKKRFPITIVMDGSIEGQAKIITAASGYLSAKQMRAFITSTVLENFSDKDGTGSTDGLFNGTDDNGLGLVNPWWLLAIAVGTGAVATATKGATRMGMGGASIYFGSRFLASRRQSK